MVHTMNVGNSTQAAATKWKNLFLLVVVSLITLGAADWVFRVYERTQLVPRLPDIDAGGPVNLDALLYNDGLVERRSAEGEFRILSFGDSFTFSVLDPQWSYNGIIQAKLQEAIPDFRFRVINLGEPATATRHFRAAYDFWSQIFQYDAVLFHIFLGNDVIEDAYLHGSMEWAPNSMVFTSDHPILKAGNRRVPQKFPLRMMDYAYAWWASSRSRSEDGLPESYNWAGLTSFDEETFNRVNFKFMENFDPAKMDILLAGYEQVYRLLQQAQEISSTGTRVAVALGPSEPQVDEAVRTAALAAHQADPAAFDMGLEQRIITRMRNEVAPDVLLIDLTQPFLSHRAATGEKLFFRRNTHWDKDGNRLAGELISRHLLESWFEQGSAVSQQVDIHDVEPLVGDAEIDAYLEPLTGELDSSRPVISGAVRAVQMMDGISGDSDNWAIAPLNKPVLIEFNQAESFSAIRLHLYHFGARQYRFTVEVRQNGQWHSVADHSETAVGGIQEIKLDGNPLSAIRITGLYNSRQETGPGNEFIHIEEVEFID